MLITVAQTAVSVASLALPASSLFVWANWAAGASMLLSAAALALLLPSHCSQRCEFDRLQEQQQQHMLQLQLLEGKLPEERGALTGP